MSTQSLSSIAMCDLSTTCDGVAFIHHGHVTARHITTHAHSKYGGIGWRQSGFVYKQGQEVCKTQNIRDAKIG